MKGSLVTRVQRPLALIAALSVLGFMLASCGGDDDSSSNPGTSEAQSGPTEGTSESAAETPDVSSVTDKQLEETMLKAFNTDVDSAELSERVVESLKIASLPITPELESEFLKCMQEPVCETGRGDKTIGIAEDFGEEVPYRILSRAATTLQALRYPSVSKIIYTEAKGDLPKHLSNIRSLVSQGADVITGTWAAGDALLPVTREATSKGVAVVPVRQAIPGATQGTDVAFQVLSDLCVYGEERAEIAMEVAGGSSGTAQLMTGPPGNAFGGEWIPCAEKVLDNNGWSFDESNTNWTPQGEQQVASALMSNPPDVIIYDYTAEALVGQYLKEGVQPPPLLAGAGDVQYITSALEAIEEYPKFKGFTATSGFPHFAVAVTLGLDWVEGGDVPEAVLPDPTVSVEAPGVQAQYEQRVNEKKGKSDV